MLIPSPARCFSNTAVQRNVAISRLPDFCVMSAATVAVLPEAAVERLRDIQVEAAGHAEIARKLEIDAELLYVAALLHEPSPRKSTSTARVRGPGATRSPSTRRE